MLAAGSMQSALLLPAECGRGWGKVEVLSKRLNLWGSSVAVAEVEVPSDLCSNLSWLLGRSEKLLINVVLTDLSR